MMRSETREDRLLEELERLRRRMGDLEKKIDDLSGKRPPWRGERVRTFVDGFDDALGGGVPKGHVVLLRGPAGTMKTSLALHMASRNANQGKKVLYVSLEETRESLRETMRTLEMEEDDFIVDIATMRLEHDMAEAGDWFQILVTYLKGKVREGLDLLVIDPFSALYPNAEMLTPRIEILHFFRFLRSAGVTTYLIYEGGEFAHQEDYMADGLIEILPKEVEPGHIALWIRCAKLRHAEHSRDAHELLFRQGRFEALPVG